MNCKTIIQTAIVAGGLIYGGSVCAETASASMLANTCAGCHGTNGSSVGPASPTIAGMSKDNFIETMAAYRNGERPATIMTRIAKGYTEDEIKLMADFFSKQKFVRLPQKYDRKLAKKGAKHHKKYCEKCHEDGGRSAEDDAGILAGQWMTYLEFSMEDFTSGNRTMEKKMKKKLDLLLKEQGEEGIEQLINFYAAQK
ncbi:MAG TPA: c-type cytochrome [Gammaproteobacteria bacterium]|nr:c-type cytochrome [Gammaproteobacteria bacterium]